MRFLKISVIGLAFGVTSALAHTKLCAGSITIDRASHRLSFLLR